jgi:type I site-specific restriction endonuclease
VASDDFLERIDAQLARLDDVIERNRVAFEGVMDAIADVRAEFEKNREAYADQRGFMRDLTRRNELVTRQAVTALRELIEESRASTREILNRLPPATA